jgi:hypothetical protein
MSPIEPDVDLRLDRHSRAYDPGEMLTGSFRVLRWQSLGLSAVELSVLWHSAGKGGEDIGVVHFHRIELEPLPAADIANPQLFHVTLPATPLSYDGIVVKIQWLVRLRLFLLRGRELSYEAPFRLGNLPAAVTADQGRAIDDS